MRGQDKYRGEEQGAAPSDGGAEGCRSCLGREFQSTGVSNRLRLNAKKTQFILVGASFDLYLNIGATIQFH